MFVVVTLVAVGCGWKFNELRQRSRAIESLKSAGWGLMFAHEMSERGYIPDARPPGYSIAKPLFGEHYASQVWQVLAHSPTPFTDADAKSVAVLIELDWLAVHDSPLTDEGLKHFAALKSLGRLDIEGTRVTKQGVRNLQIALPKTQIYSDFDDDPADPVQHRPLRPTPQYRRANEWDARSRSFHTRGGANGLRMFEPLRRNRRPVAKCGANAIPQTFAGCQGTASRNQGCLPIGVIGAAYALKHSLNTCADGASESRVRRTVFNKKAASSHEWSDAA